MCEETVDHCRMDGKPTCRREDVDSRTIDSVELQRIGEERVDWGSSVGRSERDKSVGVAAHRSRQLVAAEQVSVVDDP